MRQAGTRPHFVEIQINLATATNSVGAPVDKWRTIARAYVGLRATGGGEAMVGDQVAGSKTYLLWMPYMDGLTEKHRIKYGSRYFDINAIDDVEERHIELELTVTETPNESGA